MMPEWIYIETQEDGEIWVCLHDPDDGKDMTRDQVLCIPPTMADAEELVRKIKEWQAPSLTA